METVLSGIRPTGNLHLGNYFGAMKNFVKMQHEHNCYFFIADYHSLTTHPNPENLHNNVRMVLAEYLACGLDPEKATLYIQSDLPETAELYLLLNMNAYIGELERCTSFKEKIRKQVDNVNAGLLTYPTLMAADILIHRATKVPVGKDQEQHLEMTRTFGRRFNNIYKTEFFPEPLAFNFGEQLVKIPGLDGSGKMGKSEGAGNAIFLIDEPEVIRKKVMRALTDAGPTQENQTKPQEIQNLFDLMKVLSTPDTVEHFDNVIKFTTPIRERIKEIASDGDYLRKVAKLGAEKAHESGAKTVKEAREIIGFKKF